MKSPQPSTPNSIPRSNTHFPKHQISDLSLGTGSYVMAADGKRVNSRVTLEEGLEERATLGFPVFSPSPSSSSMVEAPVTPLICRESARAKACSLTPLTDISCHSSSKSEFHSCCFNELNEKFLGEKICSSVLTPESDTFDPFAAAPQELIFAPKKPYKIKEIFDGFEADGNGSSRVPFDKPSSPKKACKSKVSMSSVARVLKFDKCLDSGNENPRWVSNGSILLSLANKGLHGEETRLKHQHKIRLAESLKVLDQETESQASARVLNVSSRSKSPLARALDLDYEKHLVGEEYCTKVYVGSDAKTLNLATKNEEHCMVGFVGNDDKNLNVATKNEERCLVDLVGSDDKTLTSDTKDVLLEESFVETMCGSFLQAILFKQYEDANTSCFWGSNEENDESTPSTPLTYQGLSSAADSCPGAPVKMKSKQINRGTSLGSVCRKLEF